MPQDPQPTVPELGPYIPETFWLLKAEVLLHWQTLAEVAQLTVETWADLDAERTPATLLAENLATQQELLRMQSQSNALLARMMGRLQQPDGWEREGEEVVWSWEDRATTD